MALGIIMRRMRLGLIGYGAIGRHLILEVESGKAGPVDLAGILVRSSGSVSDNHVVESVRGLIDLRPDVVIEAAGAQAVYEYGQEILAEGIDLAIASAGALADDKLLQCLREAANESDSQLVLPAGAIGGIDALVAMRLGGLEMVTYRGIKPPAAWAGSRAEELCDLNGLTSSCCFFRGTAREAAIAFPKNANVAVIVGLAGLGLDRTQVELLADPDAMGNRHEIKAEAAIGRLHYHSLGYACPDNPRTSLLTVYSLIRYLLNQRTAVSL